ncbi:DUF4387 domain-containing protein [Rhodopila sp.]|uniref:DUF4387 domain-containing protein n=1 Tax=Rhodopila sp. TaxID=2480087 RepID=UPI003D097A8D
MSNATLKDLAKVVRSKNAGPFEITFDVVFDDDDVYRRVKDSGALDEMKLVRLYDVSPEDVVACMFFDPARAFKLTLRRRWAQGSVGERDTFGAQQHAPLLDIRIP